MPGGSNALGDRAHAGTLANRRCHRPLPVARGARALAALDHRQHSTIRGVRVLAVRDCAGGRVRDRARRGDRHALARVLPLLERTCIRPAPAPVDGGPGRRAVELVDGCARRGGRCSSPTTLVVEGRLVCLSGDSLGSPCCPSSLRRWGPWPAVSRWPPTFWAASMCQRRSPPREQARSWSCGASTSARTSARRWERSGASDSSRTVVGRCFAPVEETTWKVVSRSGTGRRVADGNV